MAGGLRRTEKGDNVDKDTRDSLKAGHHLLTTALVVFAGEVVGALTKGASYQEIAEAIDVPVHELAIMMTGRGNGE